jgi:hypothetical protein
MEHDLSENRSPLFRIMLMDGRSARPRFSFMCERRRRSQRRTSGRPRLLIQIPRHALPRRTLRRADIARRGFEDVLPRPPLLRMRHAIERAAQAAGRFAAAVVLAAARLAQADPPQREGVAIAALLQRLLHREAPRVFDRAKLRFGFHARVEHGGQHGEVFAAALFGVCHGQTLPSRGAFLRPRFLVRTIANGSRAGAMLSSSAKPVRFWERAGVGLPFGLPIFRFRPINLIKRRKRNAGKR